MHVNANNYTNPEWTRVGFPGGSDCKESACNVGGLGSIPGLGRFPGDENGYPLQYSGLENSYGQRSLADSIQSVGSQRVRCRLHTVRGVTKSQMQLNDFHFHFLSEWRSPCLMVIPIINKVVVVLIWLWSERRLNKSQRLLWVLETNHEVWVRPQIIT